MTEFTPSKAYADFFEKLSFSGSGRRGVAFRDDINSRWIIYDIATKLCIVQSFGEIAVTVINTAVTLSPSNPNYEADLAIYRKNGIDEATLQAAIKNANNPKFREGINAVRRLLLSMPKIGAEYSPADLEFIAVNFWYKYAGIYDFENWAEYFSAVNEMNLDGFPNTEAYTAYSRFDAVYGSRCAETIPFTMMLNEEAITGRVFLFDPLLGLGCLFPMDLLYLFKNAAAVHVCARCGQLYIKNNLSSRYCHQCKKEVGSKGIINENRKKNRARYLHKRILDKLNSSANTRGINPDDFRAESNYYWDVINGKVPKITPKCINNIQTEAQYIEWLEAVVINPYKYLNGRYDNN